MRYNRVAAVYQLAVITAFIEHAHIKPQHVSKVDSTVSAPFIRADNHHMIAVNGQIFYVVEQALDKLVSRLYSIKPL